jgi:hypothetical protein
MPVCALDSESVTCTLNIDVPLELGVPEITPAWLRLKPEGNSPLKSDHVYGGAPPAACKFAV